MQNRKTIVAAFAVVTLSMTALVLPLKEAWSIAFLNQACIAPVCVVPIPCRNNGDATYTVTINHAHYQCGPLTGAACLYNLGGLSPYYCYDTYVYDGSCPGTPGDHKESGPTPSARITICGV